MKYIASILFTILIIGCSTKSGNDKNINEELELSEDLKADNMLKRDNERYDSMKNALLLQAGE